MRNYENALEARKLARRKREDAHEGVACKKPVLFVQTTMPSLKTTVMYGYSRIPEHKAAFEERLELSSRASHRTRTDATAPRLIAPTLAKTGQATSTRGVSSCGGGV